MHATEFTYVFVYSVVVEVPKEMFTIAFRLQVKIDNNWVTIPNTLTYTDPSGEKRSVSGIGTFPLKTANDFEVKMQCYFIENGNNKDENLKEDVKP